jgi:hypothetical protein
MNRCLMEKEEAPLLLQGGASGQDRHWIRTYPEHSGACSLDPFLVWRGGADGGVPVHTGSADGDL